MQSGVKRSELELRCPRNDLEFGPRNCGGVRSAPSCALSPMATTKSARSGRTAPETNCSDPNTGMD
eukprot:12218964-Alexandrium_andersonii.AAC.1